MGSSFPGKVNKFYFFFSKTFRPAQDPIQPPIQWVSGLLSLGSKGWGVKLRVYSDLIHHTPSCCGQGQFYSFFSLTFVYFLLTLFSFQQGGDGKTKTT
jgi:hypothetical protein